MTGTSNSKSWLLRRLSGLASAVGLSLYLKYGLGGTAIAFYEAYHALYMEWLYVGYQVFKFASYYFARWEHQGLASVTAGVLLFSVYAGHKARSERRINQEGDYS